MKSVSALIFLIGAMVMICGAVWVWVYLLTTVASDHGAGFGFAALVISAILIRGYWEWISLPWRAWADLWRRWDERL